MLVVSNRESRNKDFHTYNSPAAPILKSRAIPRGPKMLSRSKVGGSKESTWGRADIMSVKSNTEPPLRLAAAGPLVALEASSMTCESSRQ